MTPEQAIHLMEITPPRAVELARFAALAARIEPELLRRLRVDVLPQLHAGDEADLWFSPLAASRGALWMLLLPEVSAILRKQLRGESEERLARARAAIDAVHVHAPEAIRIEEEILWLTLDDDAAAARQIEEKLLSAAEAIRSGAQPGLAHWALRALRNLPPHEVEIIQKIGTDMLIVRRIFQEERPRILGPPPKPNSGRLVLMAGHLHR